MSRDFWFKRDDNAKLNSPWEWNKELKQTAARGFRNSPGSSFFYRSPDEELGKATERLANSLPPLPPVIRNLPSALLPWEGVWVEWKWLRPVTRDRLLRPPVPGLAAGNSLECPLPVSYSPGLAARKLQQWKKCPLMSIKPKPFYLKTFMLKE